MHCPADYECPFCKLISEACANRSKEVVFESEFVIVFPAKHHKIGNEGNLLVVPKEHFENLYELPMELAGPMLAATKEAASALKVALGCDGISIRQHNEPAGGQDVWHYHVHVFPRYTNDNFHESTPELAPEAGRLKLATRLKYAIT